MSSTSVLDRGDGLARRGRTLDAIRLLTEANRDRPDPAIEARLVELRRDAADITRARRRRRWRRRPRDQFRGVLGVPEMAGGSVTVNALRSAILHHGCLLVRGLVSPERATRLAADVERAFTAYDECTAGSSADGAPWFVPFGDGTDDELPREWIRAGHGVAAVDSPRALFNVIEAFDDAGVRELVSGYLGEAPVLLAKKWTLRRVPPEDRIADWHQDGAFMGANIRSLDVWLALSSCGVDAPGLDVVPRRLDTIVETGTHGAHFDWSVGDLVAQRLAPMGVERPVFKPGDALILDHMLLHRTAQGPELTRPRYAIEAWFAAPSAYRSDAIAIDQIAIAY